MREDTSLQQNIQDELYSDVNNLKVYKFLRQSATSCGASSYDTYLHHCVEPAFLCSHLSVTAELRPG